LAVFVGLVPMESAFAGFANSAVMTVAAVLILTKGLTAAGAVLLAAIGVLPVQIAFVAASLFMVVVAFATLLIVFFWM